VLFLQVKLGPNVTISQKQYLSVSWANGRQATKDIAVAVFGHQTLARSSLTGLSSNASKGVAKPSLDPTKVSDIVGMFHLYQDKWAMQLLLIFAI